MEMFRFLLHEKNLPKKFWTEATNAVPFLLSRVPTRSMKGETLFEA